VEKLPCQGCRGMCCGPVPVTEQEVTRMKKTIKTMPLKKRLALKNQERYFGTCIFYDAVNDQCGIYYARPEVCKKFGYFAGLACFRKPELAAKLIESGFQQRVAGTLSIDFTWEHFE